MIMQGQDIHTETAAAAAKLTAMVRRAVERIKASDANSEDWSREQIVDAARGWWSSVPDGLWVHDFNQEVLPAFLACWEERAPDGREGTAMVRGGVIGVFEYSSIGILREEEDGYSYTPISRGEHGDAAIWEFARRLREEFGDAKGVDLSPHIRGWHESVAPPHVQEQDVEVVELAVEQAFATARFAPGTNLFEESWLASEGAPVPSCAYGFSSIKTRRVVALLREMQARSGHGGVFFVSTVQIAEKLGISQSLAWGLMQKLERAQVIRAVKRGGIKSGVARATRYRYLGD